MKSKRLDIIVFTEIGNVEVETINEAANTPQMRNILWNSTSYRSASVKGAREIIH